jgi:hypothetical protein
LVVVSSFVHPPVVKRITAKMINDEKRKNVVVFFIALSFPFVIAFTTNINYRSSGTKHLRWNRQFYHRILEFCHPKTEG